MIAIGLLGLIIMLIGLFGMVNLGEGEIAATFTIFGVGFCIFTISVYNYYKPAITNLNKCNCPCMEAKQ